MTAKKNKRIKLGDVFAIPLPDGRFGFGRRFKDAGLAVYAHIGNSKEDVPQDENYRFIISVYEEVLKSGEWPVIENRPFDNEQDAWPPPRFIHDLMNGEFSIYHLGEIHPSTEEACKGLERASVWDSNHIIDRIMGDDKWN